MINSVFELEIKTITSVPISGNEGFKISRYFIFKFFNIFYSCYLFLRATRSETGIDNHYYDFSRCKLIRPIRKFLEP